MKTVYEIAWDNINRNNHKYTDDEMIKDTQNLTGIIDFDILREMQIKVTLLKKGKLPYLGVTKRNIETYEKMIEMFEHKIKLTKEIIEDIKLDRPFFRKWEIERDKVYGINMSV